MWVPLGAICHCMGWHQGACRPHTAVLELRVHRSVPFQAKLTKQL